MNRPTNTRLTYWEYRALLVLVMCADPWPAEDHLRPFVIGLLNEEAKERGYEDWVQAYHDKE